MHKILNFQPVSILKSGYWQTVFGSLGLPLSDPPSEQMIVDVSDGDKLCCEVSTPPSWTPNQMTVVLVHGMGGSHQSRYMVRISRRLYSLGVRAVRINLRGSGSGERLAHLPSNGGNSSDILRVLEELKKKTPYSPIKLAGFSLGGNIVLKLLGELGEDGNDLIRETIVVCPAVDLYSSAILIGQPKNWLFEKYYLIALREFVKSKQRLFPGHPVPDFPKKLSIYTFDDLYTAPMSGYKNANDYYARCSATGFVESIAVPTKILFSKDDPIVSDKTITRLNYPPCVDIYETKYGGHLGYLGWTRENYLFRWMDRQVISWLLRELQN